MKILIALGCCAIYGLVVTALAYAGITLGGIPVILLGVVLFAAIKSLNKKWDEKKTSKKCEASKWKLQPIQQDKKPSQEETIVERWYTCPRCGSLVKDGEICDCAAKQKEEKAARRAGEETINEHPSVWAHRWINSQRSIGAITEEQYVKMGDAVASWEAPQEPSKNRKHDRRLMIFLSSVCALFVIVSIAFGIVLSNAYAENKSLNASISELKADHEKLEADYEKAVENYTRLSETSKRQVAIIARKNARISEMEKEFKPSLEEWGKGIYNGTVCVLLRGKGSEHEYICHRASCPLIKNVPLEYRTYFPSDTYALLFCFPDYPRPIACSACNPTD